MNYKELEYALEAVLFASGDPVSAGKLCAVLGIGEDVLEDLVSKLSDFYDYERRGIRIIKLNDSYQMCSRADYSDYIRAALETRRAQSLSQASLEVLAIIAYKQPTTKAAIEQVRGVDSTYTVNSLADKGIIEECGKLDVPGRPILYRTTDSFLRSFGLTSLEQLPLIAGFADPMNENQLTLEITAEE